MNRIGKAYLLSSLFVCLAALVACGRTGAKPGNRTGQLVADGHQPGTPAPGDVATQDGTRLAAFTGDSEAGRMYFQRCKPCHTTEPGVNSIGPSLHNVVGSPSATLTNYDYTNALRASGITWTPDKLNQFLELPRRVVPGTNMTFAGVRRPQDRADVIAYLATQ